GTEDGDVQVQSEDGGSEPLLARVQEIEIITEGVSPVIDEGVQGGKGMALGQFQFQLPLLVQVFGQFEIHIVRHIEIRVQKSQVYLALGQCIQVLNELGGGLYGKAQDQVQHLQGNLFQAPGILQLVVHRGEGYLQLVHALLVPQSIFIDHLGLVEIFLQGGLVLLGDQYAFPGQKDISIGFHHGLANFQG